MLYYDGAVPRFDHVLRTTPPRLAQFQAEAHDNVILYTFKVLFDIPARSAWNASLHGAAYDNRVALDTLPWSACRTSGAAYSARLGRRLARIS